MEILHSLALAHGVTQRMWSARQHGDKCEVLACSVLVLACNVLYCAGCISRQDVIKPDHRDTSTSHFPPLAAQ